MKNIINIISVIIAIAAVFWLKADNGFEPLIVCLASISTLAGLSIVKINEKNNGNACIGKKIIFQGDRPPFKDVVSEAKQKIWISGIDLSMSPSNIHIYKGIIRKDVKIRFMLMSRYENEDRVKETGDFRGIDFNSLDMGIERSVNLIHEKLVQTFPDKVELKLFEHRPSIGYLIIDPEDNENAKMYVLAYTYQGYDPDEPSLQINKKDNEKLFNTYLSEFEKMWSNSIEYIPRNKNNGNS